MGRRRLGWPRKPSDQSGSWQLYARLLTWVRPYWALFALAVVGFLAAAGAEAWFLHLFGGLIDNWEAGLGDAAWRIPLALVGAAVLRGVGAMLGETLLSRVSLTVVHNLRQALFSQLQTAPGVFFDASTQGHLVSRITFNVDQLRDTGTDALKSIIQDGGKVLIFVGYMLYLSAILTLVFLASAPIVAAVALYASRRFRAIARRIQGAMADLTHLVSEAVSGYRMTRIFGGEAYERARFERASRANRRRNIRMVMTKTVSTQLIQIFIVAAAALLIALLAGTGLGKELSTGDLVIFLGLTGMLARPVRKLTEVNARLQRGLAAASDVFAQLDQAPEEDNGVRKPERVRGHIEFRGVHFAYPGQSAGALRGIDFEAQAGATVALVGRSGSGKSSLANLIPRFYEPDQGEILIDGVPVREYAKADLRRQIALVGQQVTLLNDTLRANIAYGGLADADDSAIWSALRQAGADEFVRALPDGLETGVGDQGLRLSGGQRQRIALARALLKQAPILILDEATAALDSESEARILAALEADRGRLPEAGQGASRPADEHRPGESPAARTTLVITHRLSTVERADCIHVLDAGRIAEQGDHASLLARDGLFAQLHRVAHGPPSKADSGDVSEKPPPVPGISPVVRPPWPERIWYGAGPAERWASHALLPGAWLFGQLVRWRRRRQSRSAWRAPAPVLVVGGISIGGSGKTPLTLWLAAWLKARGKRPGIVARGYGGQALRQPLLVPNTDADPRRYGDEPVLLARRSGCPVAVCGQRPLAVQALLAAESVDVIISDDGLQHHALARDVEVAVLDGQAGVGNGRLLPAGPLREPLARLREVDWVVVKGRASALAPGAALMRLQPDEFINVGDGSRLTPAEFASHYPQVHAVAGIARPEQLGQTLIDLGVSPILHAWRDHHAFNGSEIGFDDAPVVCTEKDAVKLRRLPTPLGHCWQLVVSADLDDASQASLAALLEARGLL